MVFFKSFKSVFLFVLSCFFINLNVFTMNLNLSELPISNNPIKDIHVAKLLGYLTKNEFHSGIAALGIHKLEEFLKNPAESPEELKSRQAILKEFVALPDAEFKKLNETLNTINNIWIYLVKADKQNINFFAMLIPLFFIYNSMAPMITNFHNNVWITTVALSISLIMAITWKKLTKMPAFFGYLLSTQLAKFLPSVFGGAPSGAIDLFNCSGELTLASHGGQASAALKNVCLPLPRVVPSAWGLSNLFAGSLLLDYAPIPWNFFNKWINGFRLNRILGENGQYHNQLKALLNNQQLQLDQTKSGLLIVQAIEDLRGKLSEMAVYLGLAALIRENRQAVSDAPNLKRYPITFVELVSPTQTNSIFEMHIEEGLNLFNIDPSRAYHVHTSSYFKKNGNTIQSQLDLVVNYKDGYNEFFVNQKQITQKNFFTCTMPDRDNYPIFEQMLLANTFGIVFGESAKMSFYNLKQSGFINLGAFLMPPAQQPAQ